MGLFDEITKPFKKIGKELGKVGKDVGFDKWGPWAMMLLPFTPWGVALKGMQPGWMKGIMNTKLMNSAFGAAAKDAGIKYITAVAMDKEHPEDVFKSSFMTNMALGYYKTGGNPHKFFGKTPKPQLIPDTSMAASTFKPPVDISQRVMPRVTAMQPDIASAMDPALANYYDYSVPDLDILDKSQLAAREFASLAPGVTTPAGAGFIPKYTDVDSEPMLAGMGLQKKIKTKPAFWETKGMPHDMTVGSPAYDELYGIGSPHWDPAYLGLSAWQLSQGGPTKKDLEDEKRRQLAKFREDLMWRPDAPDYFDDFFLGNKGGIASLANGGRIGYQDGGPAGMSLEELKKQIFSKYMTTNYGDNQMAMGPDISSTLDYTDPDLYLGTGEGGGDDPIMDIPLGPGPSFADEFEGYMDLASGPDNQGIHDAYEDYLMSGGTLDFEDWKISIQEVMNPEDWAAARGGRMGYQGGGELNAIPGGAVSGPGTGTSDSIPAKLSNNEFVFTANAVKAAGGGDVNAGAQQLYGIMNALDPGSARVNEPPVYS
jgi:hypothetical protein